MPYADTYQSPIGLILMGSDGSVLTGLRFIDTQPEQYAFPLSEGSGKVFSQTRQWLDDYFSGKRATNMPLMNPQGTDFQCRVWQALLTIPYGETVSYGELAQQIGCRSAQAVGGTVGRNPIALLIPCHRVIGSDGSLTGYAYGIDRKRYLLEMEKSCAIK